MQTQKLSRGMSINFIAKSNFTTEYELFHKNESSWKIIIERLSLP